MMKFGRSVVRCTLQKGSLSELTISGTSCSFRQLFISIVVETWTVSSETILFRNLKGHVDIGVRIRMT